MRSSLRKTRGRSGKCDCRSEKHEVAPRNATVVPQNADAIAMDFRSVRPIERWRCTQKCPTRGRPRRLLIAGGIHRFLIYGRAPRPSRPRMAHADTEHTHDDD